MAIIKGIGGEVIPNNELWKATANKLIKQRWPKDKDFLFVICHMTLFAYVIDISIITHFLSPKFSDLPLAINKDWSLTSLLSFRVL